MSDAWNFVPTKSRYTKRNYIAQDDKPVILAALRTGGISVAMLAEKFETTERAILTLWDHYCQAQANNGN